MNWTEMKLDDAVFKAEMVWVDGDSPKEVLRVKEFKVTRRTATQFDLTSASGRTRIQGYFSNSNDLIRKLERTADGAVTNLVARMTYEQEQRRKSFESAERDLDRVKDCAAAWRRGEPS